MALAERNGGVVVNADSAQVYRDLRVVTARPSADEETRAPHRLFGHVDAADTGYSAARWAAEARVAIAEAHAAGRPPILVGGTGLYLRTLIDGIAPVPPIDGQVRAAVRAMPVAEAHALLATFDPAAAARLHANDTTRVHRALEVVRATGKPLAAWQAERTGGIGEQVTVVATILLPAREWLATRIAARTGEILANGVAEVATLLARRDIPADAPILRAIGVPEMTRLVRAEAEAAATRAALDLATGRYAKRQYTWFRHQAPPAWTRTTETDTATLSKLIETMLRLAPVDAQASSHYCAAAQQGTEP